MESKGLREGHGARGIKTCAADLSHLWSIKRLEKIMMTWTHESTEKSDSGELLFR